MREARRQEVQIAARTDVGLRRAENQDCYGSWCAASGRQLLVVADGMGGHLGGATASRMAIEEIGSAFCSAQPGEPAAELLTRAFQAANRAIHNEAQSEASLRGMGSTGVALLLEGGGDCWSGWAAHAGDSRLYRWRDGQLVQLTCDHSVGAQLRELPGMSEAELAALPDAGALLRALGPHRELEVEVQPVSIEVGDVFVLCSDGLTAMVSDAAIAAVLARHGPREATRVLIEEANRCGGADNITVQIAALPARDAVLRVPSAPARSAPAPARWAGLWDHRWTAVGFAAVLLLGLAAAFAAARLRRDTPPAVPAPAAAPRSLEPAAAPLAAAARGSGPTGAVALRPPQPAPVPARAESRDPLARELAAAAASAAEDGEETEAQAGAARAALRAPFAAYARGFRDCDFAVLAQVAERRALLWANRRCPEHPPQDLELTLLESSLQSTGVDRYIADVLEREGRDESLLRATLERRADGSWRITDLARSEREPAKARAGAGGAGASRAP